MCLEKDNLVKNISSLLEKKRVIFDNLSTHNFDTWEDFISDTKSKEVKKIGDFSENKEVLLIFAKKGTVVEITDFGCSKTYLFLVGKIKLHFEDKEDVIIDGVSTMEINIPHGGEVLEDTYFFVIDEY